MKTILYFPCIILILLLSFVYKVQAQKPLSHKILSSGGSISKKNQSSTKAVLGQTSPIETISFDGQFLLKQGFLRGRSSIRIPNSEPLISLYPNPNDGSFSALRLSSQQLSYEIRNNHGQLLQHDILSLKETSFKTSFSSGIYYFVARDKNKIQAIRFLVE